MYNLMLGDCLERMKEIPDRSVDMVLCDLPYGTTACKWDNVIPFEKLWSQYSRIAKNNAAIVLFGSGMFTANLMFSNKKIWKYNLIWEKTTPTGFLNAKIMPLRSHEDICVFCEGKTTYNPQKTFGNKRKVSTKKHKIGCEKTEVYRNHGLTTYDSTERYPKSVIVFKTDKQKCSLHPTQKPVALLEYLIKTYTNEGEMVLDNCAGSMSTVIACLNTSRNCIAIEKDENYFNIGCERVKNHILENNMNLCYSQVYGGDVICQDL